MKEKCVFLNFEKYFGFFILDKKNVHFKKAWIFSRKILICYHILKLASRYKKNNFQIVTINFNFIFWTLLGLSIIWQYLAIFSIAKIARKNTRKKIILF
jgi:hypothetical protein